jgi:hypothetical protein
MPRPHAPFQKSFLELLAFFPPCNFFPCATFFLESNLSGKSTEHSAEPARASLKQVPRGPEAHRDCNDCASLRLSLLESRKPRPKATEGRRMDVFRRSTTSTEPVRMHVERARSREMPQSSYEWPSVADVERAWSMIIKLPMMMSGRSGSAQGTLGSSSIGSGTIKSRLRTNSRDSNMSAGSSRRASSLSKTRHSRRRNGPALNSTQTFQTSSPAPRNRRSA